MKSVLCLLPVESEKGLLNHFIGSYTLTGCFIRNIGVLNKLLHIHVVIIIHNYQLKASSKKVCFKVFLKRNSIYSNVCNVTPTCHVIKA